MSEIRKIKLTLKSRQTLEGAGVKLRRAFGFNENPSLFDPFLLLDHFGSDNPSDYILGFPWHPHRGIETITYMINGEIAHEDSLGNKGVIGTGDLQWMTAGSGIIHQEMPQITNNELNGFQLWANLPSSHKMMTPRYREITKLMIPEISLDNGVRVKVLSGIFNNVNGPVRDIVTNPEYLDVLIPPGSEFVHDIERRKTTIAYVFDGQGYFDDNEDKLKSKYDLILYKDGDCVKIKTFSSQMRFILFSGVPLNEPIAWRGPIVMNTTEELIKAFKEYQDGTFIKY
ncbi:MAG: pirin family protein [Candidatus Lokiarchaeota archaeon]|nr:pirin family protein [Candidatus Lokiarchaeota archaeon]